MWFRQLFAVSSGVTEEVELFHAKHMPCADCGASVDVAATEPHVCDPSRRLEFELVALRPAIDSFDTDLQEYLSGSAGRFEAWIAAREVRRGA